MQKKRTVGLLLEMEIIFIRLLINIMNCFQVDFEDLQADLPENSTTVHES